MITAQKQEVRIRHLARSGANVCGFGSDPEAMEPPGKFKLTDYSKLRCPACVREYQKTHPGFFDKFLVRDRQMLEYATMILKQDNFFAYDTETDGLEGPVVGLSITPVNNPTHGFYFSIAHRTLFDVGHNLTFEDIELFLRPFLEDPNNTFVGWNMGYDLRATRRLGIEIQNYECAQNLGWLINENHPKRLKDRAVFEGVAKKAIKFADVVGKKSAADVMATEMAEYAIQDNEFPAALYKKFMPQIDALGLREHYAKLELPFIKVLSDMTWEGVRVIPQKVKDIENEAYAIMTREMNACFEIAGESFKISSGDSLRYILFDKLGIEPVLFTPGGKAATSLPALEILEKQGWKIAEHLANFSRAHQLVKTFTKKLYSIMDYQNRIHASFNNTGTVTGRLSSSNPNLQNIPRLKKFRLAFVPGPGKVFVIADYSQIELRMLAHFSGDKVMVNAFKSGLDLHGVTAANIYGMDVQLFFKHLKDEEEAFSKGLIAYEDLVFAPKRQNAKTVNFGIVYQGGAKKLGVSQDFIIRWRNVHMGAASYIQAHNTYAKETGVTRTLAGRYRRDRDVFHHDDYIASSGLRSLFSAHIQGSAADIVKKAMVDLYAALKLMVPTARIILQVHDELIVECEEKDAYLVQEIMKNCLENAYALDVPLVAEPTIALSWADKK